MSAREADEPSAPAPSHKESSLEYPFWLSATAPRVAARRELAHRAAVELSKQSGDSVAVSLKALVDRSEERVRLGQSISPWVSLKSSANKLLNPGKSAHGTERRATDVSSEDEPDE